MKIADIEVTAIHPERWGDDLDVVNAARVSYNKESEWEYWSGDRQLTAREGKLQLAYRRLSKQDKKLIQYLAKHKHFSPFNHSFIKVRVKAPIFVARQLVKHEYMTWNEVSRRYVDEEPEFYFPNRWRERAENTKQGSGGPVSIGTNIYVSGYFDESVRTSLLCYQNMLENNVAPEQARMVLPQNLMTEWMWSGTLKAFAKMLSLRLDPHSQAETREVAQKIRELVEPVFPVSIPALLDADL